MKDLGFFLGFFALLVILAISTAGGKGIFSGVATSTDGWAVEEESAGEQGGDVFIESAPETNEEPSPLPPPPPKLSPAEVEQKVADIYRELSRLTEELRAARLREPISPYAGLVKLSIGSARSTDPKYEYLTLRADSRNTRDVNISDWYIKSYVTDERVAIPDGDHLIERWRHPEVSGIVLKPGEEAYLMTRESPIDTSFRENVCTGYLGEMEDFSPSLVRYCPDPMEEMKRFATIELDNDSCYDFVERIYRCETPDEDDVEGKEADLNGACRRFILNTLNHDDCVEKHKNDPLFDNVGQWHIYFEEDDELWRYEREIIRLMDENDKVIDVIEY